MVLKKYANYPNSNQGKTTNHQHETAVRNSTTGNSKLHCMP